MLRRGVVFGLGCGVLLPGRSFSSGSLVDKLGVVITPEMLPVPDGENINGPSLIRVPDWLPNRLGRYYLYFAHHQGHYIRMAYANEVAGPYTVYEPGTLHLSQTPLLRDHIASPDVHVDEDRRQIVMYFHGPTKSMAGQKSFRAISMDGINFEPVGKELGISYFRVWHYGALTYALGKAQLYRSRDGGAIFEEGPQILSVPGSNNLNDAGNIRHTAVRIHDDRLDVYYSLQGAAPESILLGSIDMRQPWTRWRITGEHLILKPTEHWEGATLPIVASRAGESHAPENSVRDPAIFEENGITYLLYSVAGETGIAVARHFSVD